MELRYLTEEEMIEAGALDMEACLIAIEETFDLIAKGDYLMGGPSGNDHGLMLWFPEETEHEGMPVLGPDRRFMSLISYLGGSFQVCANKWYGSNIENKNKNLPRSIHTITLNDPDTGAPLSIMPGNVISAMRTGAVPGVAAKHLARKGAKTLGAIGSGLINQACIRAIVTACEEIEEVYIYDLDKNKANEVKEVLMKELGISVIIVEEAEEAVRGKDLITVATAGTSKPVIKDEWLSSESVLLLTGAAELEDKTYTQKRIVADLWGMHQEWRQEALSHPNGFESIKSWAMSGRLLELGYKGHVNEEEIMDLGDIINGNSKRSDKDGATVFMTGGLPVEDAAWAYQVYNKAKNKQLGQVLPLWNQPHMV